MNNDSQDFREIDFRRKHGWWVLSDRSRRQYENTFPKSDNWEQCMRPTCRKNFYPTSSNTRWYCANCCEDLIIQRSTRCGNILTQLKEEEEQ